MTPARRLLPVPAAQRGVVLFIALMVMVVLSLAGIALVRSVDTFTTVAGNLAFRLASTATANLPVERAVHALFDGPPYLIPSRNSDYAGENYYSTLQVTLPESGTSIPAVLQGTYPPVAYPGGFRVLPKDAAGNEVRYVIERVCLPAAAGLEPTVATCDMAPPKQATADQAMELDRITTGRVPFYRLTIRVDGPANTVTFAQAMLR